jgi:hypothetical protein
VSEDTTQPNAGFRWPQLAAPSSQAAVEGAPPDLTTATVARRAIAPLSMHDRSVAIVAPVGYGKTTLMGGWFRACKDADPVWVGLDASWRDQVFFVRSLLNAVGGPSEPVAMAAIDAAAVVDSGLLALLQALGQRRRPMMLFCAAMPGLCAPLAGRHKIRTHSTMAPHKRFWPMRTNAIDVSPRPPSPCARCK